MACSRVTLLYFYYYTFFRNSIYSLHTRFAVPDFVKFAAKTLTDVYLSARLNAFLCECWYSS